MLLKLEESGVVGKTELWKCQIDNGCDGHWTLDTLPPPNQAKNGNFHFHEIMQTAVILTNCGTKYTWEHNHIHPSGYHI